MSTQRQPKRIKVETKNIPEVRCSYKEMVPIKDLKPHPKNRNKHPPAQLAQFAKILQYQKIRRPVRVSNLSGFVTSGHGLIMASKVNGYTHLPVDYQDYDNEDQEYADVQADNALARQADLDLAEINLDLANLGPDFDIDWLGLKDFVIEPAEKYADKDADEIPEVKESICKPGDLWILGEHRLLCGDSTDRAQVERLMNGEKADMVYTDPPYGISIDAAYGNRMKGKEGFIKRDQKVYSNIIGDDQEFDPSAILDNFPDSKIFLWGANNYTKNLPKGGWIVWYKKTTDGMKRMFGWDFELCWTNQSAGQVYEQSWAGCFGHNKELDGETKTHPSMKSVSLILQMFKDYPSENVLDLYLGSGSTLIACEKTNRKCFGMEIDPHYCDVIVARWEKFTGKKAVKYE